MRAIILVSEVIDRGERGPLVKLLVGKRNWWRRTIPVKLFELELNDTLEV